MVYVLVLSLIFIFLFNFIITNRDICEPSNLFCLSFLICSCFAASFSRRWNMSLGFNTFLVIVFGVIVFCMASFLAKMMLVKYKKINTSTSISSCDLNNTLSLKLYKLIIFVVFQLISYYLIFNNEKELAAQHGCLNSGSISDVIYGYRTLLLDEHIGLKPVISIMRRICNTSAYIWGFLICEKFIKKIKYKKSIEVLLCINFTISLFGNMLDGQRGNTMSIVLSTLMMAYMMLNSNSTNRKKIKIKTVIKIIVVFCAILTVFQSLGSLLGRTDYGNELIDYIGIYIGAEIANLNIILQAGFEPSHLFGVLTFRQIYQTLGIDTSSVQPLGFQYSNGYQLGNVYTAFKDYLVDFGYSGYVFPIILIAIIGTIFYHKVKIHNRYRNINVALIALSEFLFTITFSFFSNKVGEVIFSKNYISFIISLILIKLYLYNIYFRNYRLYIKINKR